MATLLLGLVISTAAASPESAFASDRDREPYLIWQDPETNKYMRNPPHDEVESETSEAGSKRSERFIVISALVGGMLLLSAVVSKIALRRRKTLGGKSA